MLFVCIRRFKICYSLLPKTQKIYNKEILLRYKFELFWLGYAVDACTCFWLFPYLRVTFQVRLQPGPYLGIHINIIGDSGLLYFLALVLWMYF